jgi:hypothetical protein
VTDRRRIPAKIAEKMGAAGRRFAPGSDNRSYSLAGNEWRACVMRQLPSILQSPIVNRNSSGSRTSRESMVVHFPSAVANATSCPQVTFTLRGA